MPHNHIEKVASPDLEDASSQMGKQGAAPNTAPSALKPADHKGHTAPGGQPVMTAEIAQEMGHGGHMDLPAMARDMRNRFSIGVQNWVWLNVGAGCRRFTPHRSGVHVEDPGLPCRTSVVSPA